MCEQDSHQRCKYITNKVSLGSHLICFDCNYISAPAPPDPLEGTWKLIQCENYEKYLEKIGTGPLSLNMVMRANVVVTIAQVCIDK